MRRGARRAALAAACALSLLVLSVGAAKRKVLLSSVGVITFEQGQYCASNRGDRVPKLRCDGANCAAVSRHVASVQCKSQGTDDTGSTNWRCTGSIPKGCKFLSNRVSCEGYEGLDDDYIVPGSCGLTYSLDCGRLDGAQDEERALRLKVKQQREAEQQRAYEEMARIRGQEAADQCELAVAGALHQPGNDVEVQRYGEWVKGKVWEVACDGTYTFQPDFPPGAPPVNGLHEQYLRTWVATIYKEPFDDRSSYLRRQGVAWTAEDTLEEGCGPRPHCSGHGACLRGGAGGCRCDDGWLGGHCARNAEQERNAAVAAVVVVALVCLLLCVCGGRGGGARSGGGGAGARPPQPGAAPRRVVDTEAMDAKRRAIDKVKAAQAQLRVARVKAKQDAARQSRIDQYQVEMDQMQRDIQSDTAQLGNVMQRVDHILDTYEAVGYASTDVR